MSITHKDSECDESRAHSKKRSWGDARRFSDRQLLSHFFRSVVLLFVLFCCYLCCSVAICVVLYIVCVSMCTVILPPRDNTISVYKYTISYKF